MHTTFCRRYEAFSRLCSFCGFYLKMLPRRLRARHAIPCSDGIKTHFHFFLTDSSQTSVINMTHLRRRNVYGDTWKEADWLNGEAFIGVLILCSVDRSESDSASSYRLQSLIVQHFLFLASDVSAYNGSCDVDGH